MTEAEQNAAWDEQFYGSLGEFDKRLSKEQAEIEKQRSAAASNGGGGTQGSGTGPGAGGSSGVPQEVAGSETGADGAGGNAGQAPPGPAGGAGSPNAGGPKFPAPEGTPSGSDDDVVARQLREAAESEKDPALRERLWQEYRKYKSRK